MTLTEHMIDTKLGRLHVEVDGVGPPAVLWHSLFFDSALLVADARAAS